MYQLMLSLKNHSLILSFSYFQRYPNRQFSLPIMVDNLTWLVSSRAESNYFFI